MKQIAIADITIVSDSNTKPPMVMEAGSQPQSPAKWSWTLGITIHVSPLSCGPLLDVRTRLKYHMVIWGSAEW